MNLKLSQKGLVIFIVPLVSNLIIGWQLLSEIDQSKREFARQQQSSQRVEYCNILSKSFDDAASSITQLALTAQPIYQDNYSKAVKSAKKIVDKLSKMDGLDAETTQSIDAVKQKASEGLKLFDELNQSIQHNEEARTEILSKHLVTQFTAIGSAVEKEVNNLRKLEKKQEAQASHEHSKTQQEMGWWTIGGLVTNLIFALFFFAWFSKSISGRVRVMQDNTLRFASNQVPHAQLRGNDELAELDRAFHLMTGMIKESRQKERALVSNSSEIICSIHKQGAFTEVNPAVLETWGYAPDDLIGRKAIDIVIEEERERFHKFLEQCTTSDTAQKLETSVIDKTGQMKDVQFSCTWSNDQWYCVVSDISERKQLERMKKDFVAMISHDLRAPLASIRMLLEMLAGGMYGTLTDAGQNKVEKSDSSVQRLLGLIDQLLEVEKMEAGKVELELSYESIDDIADSASREVIALAEGKKVVLEVKHGGVKSLVDRDRLIRVIVNLLSNAIKYSPNSGTVETAVQDLDDWFEITVTDQGIGIPKEYQATVFERYEQVKEKSHRMKGGTGLGLAICKMIVEAHEGEIGVTSEGAGSTFWFRIPKKEPAE